MHLTQDIVSERNLEREEPYDAVKAGGSLRS